MTKLELTLAIIKPHAVKNPVALSFIRNVIKKNFVVVKTKRISLDKETAGDFYKEHVGKFFYNRLVTFMTSGCIDLHIMGHMDAIQLWRQLLGPTSVYKGQFEAPNCLRGMFGISDTRNVAHGSDSQISAEREIKFFFPDFSFYRWHNEDELQYRKGPIVFNNHLFQHVRRFRLSRRGRKLQVSDDSRTLVALPKEVPERVWAEILQKEENDLVVFDIREEILEDALKIGYAHYMEKQNALFTVHCAAQAWLKLINWHFYRHDPGEDPSAYPPCFIPKRTESWVPDQLPDPSPKDTWCRQALNVLEEQPDDGLKRSSSSTSLEYPVVENIPKKFWFPGKVDFPYEMTVEERERLAGLTSYEQHEKPQLVKYGASGVSDYVEDESGGESPSVELAAESELLQKVTDYSPADLSVKESTTEARKTTTPVEGSLHGAGDSPLVRHSARKSHALKSRVFSRASLSRSRGNLSPLDMDSKISVISDCRLRGLRLDTQYEISSEKVESPIGQPVKRK